MITLIHTSYALPDSSPVFTNPLYTYPEIEIKHQRIISKITEEEWVTNRRIEIVLIPFEIKLPTTE